MKRRYRAIFISDCHLGSRRANAESLASFLDFHEADTWYLVGDVWDVKWLRRMPYWPRSHREATRKLLAKTKTDRVVFVPGNHDVDYRAKQGKRLGVEVVREAVHVTADNRKFLVVHGDEHAPDICATQASSLAIGAAYVAGVKANAAVARVRKAMGMGHWSLSGALKQWARPAIKPLLDYERKLASDALSRGMHGVVAGHVHLADIRAVHAAADDPNSSALYMNSGDWVENNTALVENRYGEFSLVRWTG